MKRTEEVKVSFYNIDRCGFFQRSNSEPLFSSIADVLTQLATWTSGVDLSKTKILDANPDKGYPVYLLDIHKTGSEWVFATWNEVPASETGVASVSSNSKVGTPEVHMNEIAPNSIPGYATYFWVLPDEKLLATLQFQHKVNGQKQMQNYIHSFMSHYMSYAVIDVDAPDEYRVIGYTDPNDGKVKSNVRANFKTAAYVKTGPVEFILKCHASIKKVVRRGHVNINSVSDRKIWQSFIQFVRGNKNNAYQLINQSLYVELEYQPELDELKRMIEVEIKEIRADVRDDIGFIMEGDASKIHWISKAGAYGNVELEIDRVDEESIKLESLLSALNANKRKIMSFLETDA
ncbi:hypothetical protein [Undibacterium sp.]|uniref:hypothetical protein n=1 Tax=Undibacterium sp. TaxID=1914977 RepID=UPI0025E63D85|nr:hypothetical protein [Undibacterium sp.]